MRVDQVFSENVLQEIVESISIDDLAFDAVLEGYADDHDSALEILEEGINSKIKAYASRYSGRNPPEIMPFQDPTNRNHVAVLAAGDNQYMRFDMIGNRVVSEERFNSFKELMQEKDLLTSERYYSIDTRSWLSKNWRKILLGLAAGSVLLASGPLIVAGLMTVAAAVATFVKWGLVIGGMAGAGLLMQKFGKRNSASGSK